MQFNIDVKANNTPPRLFSLMHSIISAQPEWETQLAPRIILGLWHPCFLPHAMKHLPYCKRSYIGVDTGVARKYFWKDVDVFSMHFASLATADGERCVFARALFRPVLETLFFSCFPPSPCKQFQERVPGGG